MTSPKGESARKRAESRSRLVDVNRLKTEDLATNTKEWPVQEKEVRRGGKVIRKTIMHNGSIIEQVLHPADYEGVDLEVEE